MFLAGFKKLSRSSRRKLCFSLARTVLKLANKTRHRGIANISAAMPHLTEQEVEALAFISYQNIVFGVVECFYLDQVDFEYQISAEADAILKQGQGASVATMHMGCYEVVPFAMQVLTKRSSTLSKIPVFMPDGKKIYREMGIDCIDKNDSDSLFQLLKAINNKQVVSLHSDHYAKDTQLTFFGRETGAPCGAAILSAYGKVPLLLSFAILQPNGAYKVYVEVIRDTQVETNTDSIHKVTCEIYQRFEQIITEYPEHWYWSYKRWR